MSAWAKTWLIVWGIIAIVGVETGCTILSVIGGIGLLDVLTDGQPFHFWNRKPSQTSGTAQGDKPPG